MYPVFGMASYISMFISHSTLHKYTTQVTVECQVNMYMYMEIVHGNYTSCKSVECKMHMEIEIKHEYSTLCWQCRMWNEHGNVTYASACLCCTLYFPVGWTSSHALCTVPPSVLCEISTSCHKDLP